MSTLSSARRTLDGLAQLSPSQRGLTTVIATAPVLAWGCSLPAGATFSAWTLVAVVFLTMFTVVGPDSPAGLSTVLLLCWYWLTHVSTHLEATLSPWALAASLSLLAFHAAAAARATAPGPADLDRAFWRRWLSRVAVIGAATIGVWGMAALMASTHPGRDSLTLAAFAVLIGGTAYARWAIVRDR